MGAFDQVDEVPRRVMVLFFIVDTSASMNGEKIASLNVAVREVIPTVSELAAENSDALIKIAVMEFSSGMEWMYPQPIEVEKFQWRDLEAGGLTCLGEACTELCTQLSTKAYMAEPTGSFAPAIILMSDGEPTDDYKRGLEKLKGNPWFRDAIKVAIAIGNDANQDILVEFTGNSEAVLTVHNKEQLKKIIHFVSVRSSIEGSKRASVGKDAPDTKQEVFVEKIKEELANDKTLNGVDVGTDVPTDNDSDWDNW